MDEASPNETEGKHEGKGSPSFLSQSVLFYPISSPFLVGFVVRKDGKRNR